MLRTGESPWLPSCLPTPRPVEPMSRVRSSLIDRIASRLDNGQVLAMAVLI